MWTQHERNNLSTEALAQHYNRCLKSAALVDRIGDLLTDEEEEYLLEVHHELLARTTCLATFASALEQVKLRETLSMYRLVTE